MEVIRHLRAEYEYLAGTEINTAAVMKYFVLWNMTTYCALTTNIDFGEIYGLHLQR
jgi:hypothetical protein